ncbi:MAG: hypothetical protein ICV68_01255 [Pyrinomonadaceae bacterium]|nr:hypothetical protein [Pyrinomonadaceae bacterium]
MTDEHAESISPFACDMNAIEPERRGEHMRTSEELFRAVEEMRELANGYAFRLANEPEVLLKAAQFIALEKLCCPFFGFTLEVEPEGGAVWLSLTGREGVKPFIMAEIGDHLNKLTGRQGSVNLQ